MNAMIYKNYTARIEFDDRDNVFWGKVLGILDTITFEGQDVKSLTDDFHRAIDFYLEDCKATGRAPQKPYSGKVMLRLPPELHARAAAMAHSTGKSLNAWVADVLKHHFQ